MPFCPQCGVDNPDSARYCDQCGAALIPVPSSTPSTAAGAASVAPVPVGSAPDSATLVTGPIICPQCGATAIPGEAFCDNCGAPLNAPSRPAAQVPVPPYSAGFPAQPTYPPPQPSQPSVPVSRLTPPPVSASPPNVAAPPSYTGTTSVVPPSAPPVQARMMLAPAQLIVAATNTVLPLPNSAQVVIGRADPVSKFFPDIDLTPYGALESGVGRRHARLAVEGGQLVIEDLDSTNGTLLNGQKLAARQLQPLKDGDQIQLGKLVLRIQL